MQLVFGTAGTSLYILVFSPRTALIFIVFTEGLPAGCKAVLGAEIDTGPIEYGIGVVKHGTVHYMAKKCKIASSSKVQRHSSATIYRTLPYSW